MSTGHATDPASFYDQIAEQYEHIVAAGQRSAAAERLAKWLVESRQVRSALEVACGSGMYSRELARLGVKVTAADISREMIERGKAAFAADEHAANIHWVVAPMETISQVAQGPFDAVLCMGNSLPHLLEESHLRQTLQGFARVLGRGGLAVVSLLNYRKILATGERIVGATRSGDREFIRFYDFEPLSLIRFNILELRWEGPHCEHRLHQTMLRPYTERELSAAMTECGFARIEMFGGLDFSPFDPDQSDVLALVAWGAIQ